MTATDKLLIKLLAIQPTGDYIGFLFTTDNVSFIFKNHQKSVIAINLNQFTESFYSLQSRHHKHLIDKETYQDINEIATNQPKLFKPKKLNDFLQKNKINVYNLDTNNFLDFVFQHASPAKKPKIKPNPVNDFLILLQISADPDYFIEQNKIIATHLDSVNIKNNIKKHLKKPSLPPSFKL